MADEGKQADSVFSQVAMAAFIVCLPFLYYGFVRSFISVVGGSTAHLSALAPFALGVAVFFPFNYAATRFFHRGWSFVKTLEHEITHILVALVFFKVPTGIRVTAYAGGHARYVGLGRFGWTWIALAPYFLPTLPIVIVIAAFLAGIGGWTLTALLGTATAFHLVTNWQETSLRQTDLQKVGIARSVLILPFVNLVSYGIVLAFVTGGSTNVSRFLSNGLVHSPAAFIWLSKTVSGSG